MDQSVSIITAVYNGDAFLENCILSVLAQTHPGVEHIIVDGGSTDGTLGILEKYRDRVRFTSESDKGLYDAMNKGVARAQGKWVLFLGADDFLASAKTLDALFAKLPSDLAPYGILTGHALYQDGRLYRSHLPPGLKWRNCIHHQGALYRRDLLLARPFDLSLRTYADYEFNIVSWRTGIKFLHTDQLLCVLGVAGMSDRPQWKNYREDMLTRARHFKGPVLYMGHAFAVLRYFYKRAWHARAMRR